jgi:arylsulfatase A-like enzyme
MDVHDPYMPPQPYRDKFSTEKNPGGLLNWQFRVPATLTPKELQSEVDAYDGAIAYVDDQIDKLIAEVQRRDPGRDLLVVLTSDHGEQFNEHGGFLHGGQLHRELLEVPLIFWRSKGMIQGVRVNRPVSNAAIPATIASLVGVQGNQFANPSLDHLWREPEEAKKWPFPLAELKQRDWEAPRLPVHYGSMRSLVSPTHHYIQNEGLEPELYDWMGDRSEKKNLAKDPEMKIVIDRFRNQLSNNSFSDHFDESGAGGNTTSRLEH